MAGTRSTFASGLDKGKFEVWLYNYYIKNQRLKALLYEKDPLLGMLEQKKASKVAGSKLIENLKYSRNPNSSRQFDIAQKHAKAQSSQRATFTYNLDKDFGVARLSNEVIYASADDTHAFISAFKDEMDDILDALVERRADDVWGSGTSARGEVGKDVTASEKVIELKDASSLTNFDKGDKIQIYAGSTALVQDGSGNTSTVFTIDKVERKQSAPKITVLEGLPEIDSSTSHKIYKEGDFGQIAMEGIASLIPATAPASGDNVFGTDRSVAPERLAGVRDSLGASENYASFFRKIATECRMLTGKVPDTLWINPLRENAFIDELGDKVRYNTGDQDMGKGTVGFGGVNVVTPYGKLKVMSSLKVPVNRAYGLNLDTFSLKYIAAPGNKWVDFMPTDGSGKKLVSYDDAGVEVRVESYGALTCNAPGCNFVADLSAKAVS